MNEVTVLSTAGELAGRALGHGVLLARRSAVAAGRGATALGVAAARASSRAAADAVRARRRVVEGTGSLGLPEVRLPSADGLRRDLAAAVAPSRRRRWPWVVLSLGVLAGGTVVAASRRPVAPPPAPAPPRVEDLRDPALRDPAR